MKTFLATGILLICLTVQSFGMGHPHNLFAAHKQMHSKSVVTVVHKPVLVETHLEQSTNDTDSPSLGTFLLRLLANWHPARLF